MDKKRAEAPQFVDETSALYDNILAETAEVNSDNDQVVSADQTWRNPPVERIVPEEDRDLILMRDEKGKVLRAFIPQELPEGHLHQLPENSLHTFSTEAKMFPEGENRQFPTEGGIQPVGENRQFPQSQPERTRQASWGFDFMRQLRTSIDQWFEDRGLGKLVGKRNKELRKALKPLDPYAGQVDIQQLEEGEEKSIQMMRQLQQAVTEGKGSYQAQQTVINVTNSPYGKMHLFSQIFKQEEKNEDDTQPNEKTELFKEVVNEVLEEMAETLLEEHGSDVAEILTERSTDEIKELFIEKMAALFEMSDWQTEALGHLVDNFGAADIIIIAKLFLGKEISKVDMLKTAARWTPAMVLAFKTLLGLGGTAGVATVAYEPVIKPGIQWVKKEMKEIQARGRQGQQQPAPQYYAPVQPAQPAPTPRQAFGGRHKRKRYFSQNNQRKVPAQPVPVENCDRGTGQGLVEAVNKGFQIPEGGNFINTINSVACRALEQVKDSEQKRQLEQRWADAWQNFQATMKKMYYRHRYRRARKRPYERGRTYGDTSIEAYKVTQDFGIRNLNRLKAGTYVMADASTAQSETAKVLHAIATALETQKGS